MNAITDRNDPSLTALQSKITATLIEVLGAEFLGFPQLRYLQLDEAPEYFGSAASLTEVRQGFSDGIARTIAELQTLIDLFEERLDDSAEVSTGRARRAFGDLDLHPDIARAAVKLFEDGHYANAVEDACKALDALVKQRSGRHDLSGTDLMKTVFSAKTPTLRFSDLQTDSERSEQEGMMYLYAGAMLALRNPRAHGLLQDTPEGALEYVAFVSLLAKALDRARR